MKTGLFGYSIFVVFLVIIVVVIGLEGGSEVEGCVVVGVERVKGGEGRWTGGDSGGIDVC